MTKQRRQILDMYSNGMAPKEIAWELGIKQDTVYWHLLKLKEALSARTNPHIITLAMRQGLVR